MRQNPLGKNPNFKELSRWLNRQKKTAESAKKQEEDPGPERFDSEGNPVRRKKKRFFGKGKKAVLAAAVLVVLASNCYYILDEENYAVVTTLGSAQAVSQAGLHLKIPFIQSVRKVSKGIKGMPIGYDPGTGESDEAESIMITKDFNFVNTDFYLEYMVNDPVKYLYASSDPVNTLKMLAQSYIRDTVGSYSVDEVITTGKSEIQAKVKALLSERLEQEDIGLGINNVTIQDAQPPTDAVNNAFKAVEDAKQGMDTKINEARKYQSERLPAANAEADKAARDAEAYRQQRISEAEGQVSRFNDMYQEYAKYPLITKKRMFYETMEDVLPSMKVYIVDESGTQKMLPLDSFTSAMRSAGSGSGTAGNSAETGNNSAKTDGNSASQAGGSSASHAGETGAANAQ